MTDAPVQQDIEAPADVHHSRKGDGPGEIEPENTDPLGEGDVNPLKRGCTDLVCCVLFLVAILALISMNQSCLQRDNPFKILHPLDHAGRSCGVGDMKDFPLVYYPAKKMITGGPLVEDAFYGNPVNRWSVCTSECPSEYTRKDRVGKCNEPKAARTNSSWNSEPVTSSCTWYSQAPATAVLGKYCIVGLGSTENSDATGKVCSSAQEAVADVHAEAKRSFFDMSNVSIDELQLLKARIPAHQLWVVKAIEKSINDDALKYSEALEVVAKEAKDQHIVKVCADSVAKQESTLVSFTTDVANAGTVLALSAVMCLFFGLCYLLLVCKLVKIVVWGSLFTAILGFSTTGYVFWTQGITVKDTGMLEEGQEEQILAAICWIVAFILLVVVLLCRRALSLAIAISETTSGFMVKNMGVLVLPQLIALLELLWVGYWLCALVAIVSTAKVKPADNLTQEIARFEVDDYLWMCLAFHCYMGMWVHFFFEGLAVVTSSITVTEWYFSPKVDGSKPSSQFAVFSALGKALFYHLGSIAFGSCILPIVIMLQLVIRFLQYSAVQMGADKDSTLFKCMCCCLNCCMSCMVNCLQFISNSAYIMVGVQGTGFCKAGWATWSLMARNPRRFIIFKGVMWTVDVACRFLLMGATLACGFWFLNEKMSPDVKSPWPVMLAIALIGYFISGLIASVYTTCGAALFVCFVVDEEITKTTGRDSSLYAPSGLQGLLDAETKKDKEAKEKEDEEKND